MIYAGLSSGLGGHSWAQRYLSGRNLVYYGLLEPDYWLWLCRSIRRGDLVIRHCESSRKWARQTRMRSGGATVRDSWLGSIGSKAGKGRLRQVGKSEDQVLSSS